MEEGATFLAKGKTYHLEAERMNPYVLTAGSAGRIQKLARYLDHAECSKGDRGLVIVHGTYKGTPVSGVTTGMGPASCAIVLPEVIELIQGNGVLLRIGTAGSLQARVCPGHAVVALACIRDEDTTQALVGPEYPAVASFEMFPFLLSALGGQGFLPGKSLWMGVVHTKSDLYFKEAPQFSPKENELRERLKSYRQMGALASEMELSAHFLLKDYYTSSRRRILSGGILGIVANAPESGRVAPEEHEGLEDRLLLAGLESMHTLWTTQSGEANGCVDYCMHSISEA